MTRHPPFRGGPAGGGDFLTKQGAEKLAAMIRLAWAKAGHDVPAIVVASGAAVLEKNQYYCVQMPTLLNGLPR
jgi:hypothetical protein